MTIRRLFQKIKRVATKVKSFPQCIIAWHYLRSIKEPNEAIFVTSCAIGDIVFGMAYINTWANEHKDYNPVVIADSTKRDIFDAYSGVERIVYLDKNSNIGNKILIKYNRSKLFSYLGKSCHIYNTIPIQIFGTSYHKSCLELLKKYLEIKDTTIQYPTLKNENHSGKKILEYNYSSTNVIVINPYSSGSEQCPCIDVITDIIKYYSSKGYMLFSNVVGNQRPLPGTEALSCSLKDFYVIADNVHAVISERSGIMDWLINTKAKKVILYPDRGNAYIKNIDYKEMFGMKQWNKDNVLEVFLWEEELSKAKNIIIEYLDEEI